MKPTLLPLQLLILAACGGSEVCPAELRTGAVVAGDGNGDGLVDVADGSYVLRHTLFGGPELACVESVDVLPNFVADLSGTTVDASDGIGLWNALFVGSATLPTLAADNCTAAATREDEATCGRLAFTVDAPRKVEGAPGATVTFEAAVLLQSRDLEPEAWSVSLATDGCTATAATTQGTVAAERRAGDGGKRDAGYDRTVVSTDGGAVSAVGLSWRSPVVLEASRDEQPILLVTLEATAPERGCEPCALTLADGQEGGGASVTNRISVGGRSYGPDLEGDEVKICAE
jgi:hypothetical protein